MFSGFGRSGSHARSSKSHGSHHEGKTKARASGKTYSSGRSTSGSKSKERLDVNFLFVVNELNLDLDFPTSADQWGNPLPPETWDGYVEESQGRVFRYKNGVVTVEDIYTWHRPGPGLAGSIGWWSQNTDETGNPIHEFQALDPYSTFSVFNCGPFLPCIFGGGDVTVHGDDEFYGWRALHFIHEGGVSQASPNGSHKIVAGRNAGFIDGLLPRAYRNTNTHAPVSQGLGGHIGIVIALMALSQRRGAIDAAFARSHWHNNRWTGQRDPAAWPTVQHDPRGVLVYIALESDGRPGSYEDDIQDFEWGGIAVVG
ncbi:uncharacterized protein JN550_008387 [Neoarthrinium moseri]|uniref:uncharacterized protein n=1 Tax=Neoarthrinium moseri TaxID=1658444 RepID=UPI001FDBA305|nr:uncharacterized protein JN550_008387 [Neoarthrinium moseri]KAI1865339.1 hypothetical protein JN550_008387 [Neoarthrinium moseri]